MIEHGQISSHPWVIIGCGYTGTYLAHRLVKSRAPVWVTRRSETGLADLLAELGHGDRVHGHVVDLDDAQTLVGWLPQNPIIVCSAPPAGPDAEKNLVDAAAGAARIVYISSTGVYPPGNGDWVDEDTPVNPESSHGRARLYAETALLDAARARGIAAVSLRAAGIYGPGRGVVERLRTGTYRVIGAGQTYVNRIHVADLVTVILAAALIPVLPRPIYNVADDLPEQSRVYADAVADMLGVAHPPSVPESQVDPRVLAMLGANRRIRNTRIKTELGVTLAYPTWREGTSQILNA